MKNYRKLFLLEDPTNDLATRIKEVSNELFAQKTQRVVQMIDNGREGMIAKLNEKDVEKNTQLAGNTSARAEFSEKAAETTKELDETSSTSQENILTANELSMQKLNEEILSGNTSAAQLIVESSARMANSKNSVITSIAGEGQSLEDVAAELEGILSSLTGGQG